MMWDFREIHNFFGSISFIVGEVKKNNFKEQNQLDFLGFFLKLHKTWVLLLLMSVSKADVMKIVSGWNKVLSKCEQG